MKIKIVPFKIVAKYNNLSPGFYLGTRDERDEVIKCRKKEISRQVLSINALEQEQRDEDERIANIDKEIKGE